MSVLAFLWARVFWVEGAVSKWAWGPWEPDLDDREYRDDPELCREGCTVQAEVDQVLAGREKA